MEKQRVGIRGIKGHWKGFLAVLIGIMVRTVMARTLFLQADEEIFSYDAYYFILGRSLDFIVGRIGAYLLYPLALAGWFKVFGTSLFAARMFTVLCWAVIMSAFYLILLKVTKDRKWAFIGTLLLAVLPYPLRYGHVALSEPIAWAFITVSVLFLIEGMEHNRWWAFLLSGSLCAVAFFARRSALILPIFIVPGLVWVNRGLWAKAAKQTLSFAGGFALPMVLGLGSFIAIFGWDRLMDLGFLRVPHLTQDLALDLSAASTYDSALYALQPTIWKSLPLLIPFIAGCAVLLASLHRNIWKVVLTSCLLWPALVRMTLDGEATNLEMFLVTIAPLLSISPFLARLDPQKAAISLSLLLGGAVAFSNATLSLDIWNVVLYTGVGAVLMIYLDDRLDSQLGSFVLLGAGLALLTLICFREPQITTLLSMMVPVSGAVFFLMLPRANAPDVPMLLKVTGLVLVQLMVGLPDLTGLYLPFVLILPVLVLIALGDKGERAWKIGRYFSSLGALAFLPLIPEAFPVELVVLPLLVIPIIYVSRLLPSNRWVRVGGVALAFIASSLMVHIGTGSLVLGVTAGVLSGSAAALSPMVVDLTKVWRSRVPERVSVILFLLVIAYLTFYIYYAWTEVYLMELIVPASIIAALFLMVLLGPGVRMSLTDPVTKKVRGLRTFFPDRRLAVLGAVLLVISVPASVGAFLEDDWFKEEPMDQRPYMSTIMEIAGWIKDNTDKDDKVLAWHCYAIEADRETIIEVSNAARYDGRKVIEDMIENNVTVFVRCYYTDHGIWEDQPYFQDHIKGNFTLDRVIDGNECYLKVRGDPY